MAALQEEEKTRADEKCSLISSFLTDPPKPHDLKNVQHELLNIYENRVGNRAWLEQFFNSTPHDGSNFVNNQSETQKVFAAMLYLGFLWGAPFSQHERRANYSSHIGLLYFQVEQSRNTGKEFIYHSEVPSIPLVKALKELYPFEREEFWDEYTFREDIGHNMAKAWRAMKTFVEGNSPLLVRSDLGLRPKFKITDKTVFTFEHFIENYLDSTIFIFFPKTWQDKTTRAHGMNMGELCFLLHDLFHMVSIVNCEHSRIDYNWAVIALDAFCKEKFQINGEEIKLFKEAEQMVLQLYKLSLTALGRVHYGMKDENKEDYRRYLKAFYVIFHEIVPEYQFASKPTLTHLLEEIFESAEACLGEIYAVPGKEVLYENCSFSGTWSKTQKKEALRKIFRTHKIPDVPKKLTDKKLDEIISPTSKYAKKVSFFSRGMSVSADLFMPQKENGYLVQTTTLYSYLKRIEDEMKLLNLKFDHTNTSSENWEEKLNGIYQDVRIAFKNLFREVLGLLKSFLQTKKGQEISNWYEQEYTKVYSSWMRAIKMTKSQAE